VKIKSTLLAALSLVFAAAAPMAGAQEKAPKPSTAPAAKANATAQRTQGTATATTAKDASARAQPVQNTRAVPAAPGAISTNPKSGEFGSGCHHSKESDA